MKNFILCKLSCVVFVALLAVSNISANERQAVYYCVEEQSVFLESEEIKSTSLERFTLKLTDQSLEVVNDGYFKDGYTFPIKELPNAQGGITAGFGGHTMIFVRPHFFYSFNFMGSEKSQMATILLGRCEAF